MEIRETQAHVHGEDGTTTPVRWLTVREPFADEEQYLMRVWVDDGLAMHTEPVLVEFNDFRMNPDDATEKWAPMPVVRWDGELIVAAALTDGAAFWLHDAKTLEERMEWLTEFWERYRLESSEFRAGCTFVAYVMEN